MKNKIMISSFAPLLVCGVMVIAGCKNSEDDKFTDFEKDFWKKWRQQAEIQRAVSPIPEVEVLEKVKENEVSEEQIRIKEKELKLSRKVISLKVANGSVSSTLKALAKLVNQNIIIDSGVIGQLSLELVEVPWNEAFHSIMKNNSLDYKWQSSILRIISAESMQKELSVRELHRKIAVLKHEEDLTSPLVLKTVKIKHLDINRLHATIDTILKNSAKATDKRYRGSVVVDEDTNNIIVNAVPKDVNKIVDLITILDKPSRQIHIEAKIVVTTQRKARELGVQWGGLGAGGHGGFLTAGANSQGILEGAVGTAINPTSGWMSNFPSSSLANLYSGALGSGGPLPGQLVGNSGFTGGLAFQRSDLILNMQLSALESSGQANILSTPSITTLDNHLAFIESGTEIPYQSTSDNNGIQIEFKKAVLRLEVTPHIIDGELIQLKVFATNDEPDRTLESRNDEPAIFTRKASTTVMLLNGQTTVIAGLLKEFRSDTETGIPYLMDLPWIGGAFRSSGKDQELNDLLIFLTPYILEEKLPIKARLDRQRKWDKVKREEAEAKAAKIAAAKKDEKQIEEEDSELNIAAEETDKKLVSKKNETTISNEKIITKTGKKTSDVKVDPRVEPKVESLIGADSN